MVEMTFAAAQVSWGPAHPIAQPDHGQKSADIPLANQGEGRWLSNSANVFNDWATEGGYGDRADAARTRFTRRPQAPARIQFAYVALRLGRCNGSCSTCSCNCRSD